MSCKICGPIAANGDSPKHKQSITHRRRAAEAVARKAGYERLRSDRPTTLARLRRYNIKTMTFRTGRSLGPGRELAPETWIEAWALALLTLGISDEHVVDIFLSRRLKPVFTVHTNLELIVVRDEAGRLQAYSSEETSYSNAKFNAHAVYHPERVGIVADKESIFGLIPDSVLEVATRMILDPSTPSNPKDPKNSGDDDDEKQRR